MASHTYPVNFDDDDDADVRPFEITSIMSEQDNIDPQGGNFLNMYRTRFDSCDGSVGGRVKAFSCFAFINSKEDSVEVIVRVCQEVFFFPEPEADPDRYTVGQHWRFRWPEFKRFVRTFYNSDWLEYICDDHNGDGEEYPNWPDFLYAKSTRRLFSWSEMEMKAGALSVLKRICARNELQYDSDDDDTTRRSVRIMGNSPSMGYRGHRRR